MGKINVLSFAVANLIAAGEVVDRPSSVIKELLENAIDSGADRITVEIQNGGVAYMRVSDNGCGMTAEDLPVAIRRHATSKIKEAEDLNAILTLGFRGEALAAIASVSDLRIISKTKDSVSGSMLEAHGGNIVGVTERAASDGTTVIVENLFANVPARRKFLKKDVTETMAVGAVVEKIALSNPNISFRFIADGNIRIDTVGDGDLKNTVYSIFGKDFTSRIIPAENSIDGIKVKGFIGRSDNVKANRNYQNFFINGRYVKCRTAGAAIEQAFTSYIPPDKFPCCILFIDINPATVDVNVHPAKLEVKFSNEKPVFEAVYYAVRNALESNTARPSVVLDGSSKDQQRAFDVMTKRARTWTSVGKMSDSDKPIIDEREESLKKRQITSELFTESKPKQTIDNDELNKAVGVSSHSAFSTMTSEQYRKEFADNRGELKKPQISVVSPPASTKEEEKSSIAKTDEQKHQTVSEPNESVKENIYIDVQKEYQPKTDKNNDQPKEARSLEYRIVGEAFNSYVIVEIKDRMLLIDKHAAHERIIFEKLRAGMNNNNAASQMLMLPIDVMLTSDEIQTIAQYSKEIEAIGFEFTTGKYTVSVTAIPDGIQPDAVSDMLAIMADRIKSNTGSAKLTRDIIFEKALYQASCKAAIKAGREYPPEYTKWLVDKLMELPDITVCPHGRPVAMELSKKSLDRQFERT